MSTRRKRKANPTKRTPTEPSTDWLTSDQTRKGLKISSCDLMHHRLAGKVGFRKEGNAFLYSQDDVRKLKDG
jgi:hypothetical protein